MESLLFAGLALMISATSGSTSGRRFPVSARLIAFGLAVGITVVAAGGVCAWCDLFVVRGLPVTVWAKAASITILFGLATPVVLSWLLVLLVPKSRRSQLVG